MSRPAHEEARHWCEALAHAIDERSAASPGERIVCASGISPSGPIHMGNLREVMTTHLVVEALRRRGRAAEHLHSWDDYDRLRKVPAGVHPDNERYVGMPLGEIPDPFGTSPSWADHFIDEFAASLAELGVDMHAVRQSERYPAGTYNALIRRAMEQRTLIFDTLAAQQTAGRHATPIEERRAAYYPFKPYCEVCRRDDTIVTAYSDESVDYVCRQGHQGTMSLGDGARISGKLVWKVDWPMRWRHEAVVFEPAGEDHHAPTGSFTVGRTLVADVFGGEAPLSAVYSFVTLAGAGGKMSSSVGGAVTPSAVMSVVEPACVRWPYVQRTPSQGLSIDLTPRGVQNLYDHWDHFVAQATAPGAKPEQRATYRLTVESSAGRVHSTPRPVSFRLLSAAADITQANREQMARIVAAHLPGPLPPAGVLLDELEPRLTCAIRYATELVPPEERTVIRDAFAKDVWEDLDDGARRGVDLLRTRAGDDWSLEGLTMLVYAIPKLLLDLPADAASTSELKRAQREFFKVVYRLLIDGETGPRLPTLLLSIGRGTAERLLGGGAGGDVGRRPSASALAWTPRPLDGRADVGDHPADALPLPGGVGAEPTHRRSQRGPGAAGLPCDHT